MPRCRIGQSISEPFLTLRGGELGKQRESCEYPRGALELPAATKRSPHFHLPSAKHRFKELQRMNLYIPAQCFRKEGVESVVALILRYARIDLLAANALPLIKQYGERIHLFLRIVEAPHLHKIFNLAGENFDF